MCTFLDLGYQNRFLDTSFPKVYSEVRETKHLWHIWLKSIQVLSWVQILTEIARKHKSSQIFSFYFNSTAKSLQSCLTLCDPIDSSPPGSAIPGILQARTLEWVAISFSNHESEKWKWSRSVVSDPQWPHGLQPTRLLHPWDSPGKSTGVGCHCLLRCMGYIPLLIMMIALCLGSYGVYCYGNDHCHSSKGW